MSPRPGLEHIVEIDTKNLIGCRLPGSGACQVIEKVGLRGEYACATCGVNLLPSDINIRLARQALAEIQARLEYPIV